MSFVSLAEFIPIELINHILSYRPRHPDACIIKNLKEEILNEYKEKIDRYNNYYRFEYDEDEDEYIIPEDIYEKTFIDLNYNVKFLTPNIFSYDIRPNSIYKLKIKNDKDSNIFYWGKYYTEIKAIEAFINHLDCRDTYDIYYIAVVNIHNDTLKESIIKKYGDDSEDDSDDSSCGCGRGCETSDDEYEDDSLG